MNRRLTLPGSSRIQDLRIQELLRAGEDDEAGVAPQSAQPSIGVGALGAGLGSRGPMLVGEPGPRGLDGRSFDDTTHMLGENFATLECFKVVAGVAMKVTSLDTDFPDVDGVTMESGSAGQDKPVAMIQGAKYVVPSGLTLPGIARSQLFLGQDGKMTTTPPSRAAGDLWLVHVGIRIDDTHFIYSPGSAILLY